MEQPPCLQHFSDNDTDLIVYSGAIARDGYDKLCQTLQEPKRSKLLLILNTYGGDPNAGYRIARAAIHNYGAPNFRILVPSYCKSAGTLICIGASALIMADQAELGPLDVQLRKQDELFQQSSGLDILRGVTYLQNEALQSFKTYLIDINGGAVLSTRVASEIASELVIGLYEPLFAQVDPVKLGEMNAALQIAQHYGDRLNRNSGSLAEGALNQLIMGYPTHGFVIDRAEARTLFRDVRAPDDTEKELCALFRNSPMARATGTNSAIVLRLNPQFAPTNDSQLEKNDEPVPRTSTADEIADLSIRDEQQPGEPDVGTAPNDEPKQPTLGGEQDDSLADAERHA